jgi:hypothetical protein
VHIVHTELPEWLRRVGALFPLKWMAQGLRSAFPPDSFGVAETAGSWEHGTTALVLAAWLVGAFAASAPLFRWRGRYDQQPKEARGGTGPGPGPPPGRAGRGGRAAVTRAVERGLLRLPPARR